MIALLPAGCSPAPTTMFHPRDILRLCLPILALIGAVRAEEPFEAFLEKHCIRCHGPEKEKGDIRLDRLSRDFKLGADSHQWAEAIEKVNSGEMPPKKEKRPTQEEIAGFASSRSR